MDSTTRDKISETQFRNWEHRRRGLEQLEALKKSHRRTLELLQVCAVLVERQAAAGDPLARHVVAELDKAEVGMKAENIAASDFVNEHTS